MNTHKIVVTLENGALQVSPDPLVMTSKDEVHWASSSSHRFSIEFDGQSPFATGKLNHDAANAKQRATARGRFKYTVVLESDPSVRLDPIIVVEEPPTRPGP